MSVKLCSPMPGTADGDAVIAFVRSWGEQAVSIMGQTSRCCMVCLMPQSHVSGSLENPHFNMFTLDRPTCVRNRLSAFQVVQGFSAPAERCSSAHWRPGSRVVLSIASSFRCRVDGLRTFDEVFRYFRRGTTPEMSIEWVPLVHSLPCPM